jgi:bifunctional DNA-binding transcriptional regulator/antitoxin component of YhaV-PrlF toxin-antitoxin module
MSKIYLSLLLLIVVTDARAHPHWLPEKVYFENCIYRESWDLKSGYIPKELRKLGINKNSSKEVIEVAKKIWFSTFIEEFRRYKIALRNSNYQYIHGEIDLIDRKLVENPEVVVNTLAFLNAVNQQVIRRRTVPEGISVLMCDAGDSAIVFYARVLPPFANGWPYNFKATVDKKTGILKHRLEF